jgi:phage terminase small subunit
MSNQGGGAAYAGGVIETDARSGRFVVASKETLTDKQRQFVENHFANGGDATKAAKDAGYANPMQDSWRLRQNPAVLAAIRATAAQAVADGAPVAWGVMQELMTQADTPAQVRFQAARWTLEAGGHGLAAQALLARAGGAGEKAISEMSVAELEEYVKRQQSAVDALKACEGRVVDTTAEVSAD